MIASAATRGVDSDGLRYGAIEGRAQPVAIHTCLDIVKRKTTPSTNAFSS
jgi:hypothetical protein